MERKGAERQDEQVKWRNTCNRKKRSGVSGTPGFKSFTAGAHMLLD
jgi:hypothetical protein